MDLIIEPGDYAFEYDHGPTAKRRDAVRTAPVSLYQTNEALDRQTAREVLGLDKDRPAVLVQLGTGADDANEKMTAALKGLIDWPNLQVVLTKEPIDKNGNSLAPKGLDIKVIRYFPLAKVLSAFDACICATGYNGVHELLAAGLPTVLVSNIRGMDDQDARARWCHDHGYAIRANQADLSDITNKVRSLEDQSAREKLSANCASLPVPIGGEEIANNLTKLAFTPTNKENNVSRTLLYFSLRYLAIAYRKLVPQKNFYSQVTGEPVFSDSKVASDLRSLIKADSRFEHLISPASSKYKSRREQIAKQYY
jgi:hypothetical protein